MLASFAQPGPVELAAFLASLLFLVSGVNAVMKLVDRMKEKPPPAETYTTLAQCRTLHTAQDHRISQTECAVESLRQEMKDERGEMMESLRRIHARIDAIPPALGELKGRIDMVIARPQRS
jgi:hypothetical protein